MERLPSVSILTPSYNYARFIDDALRSVAFQAGDMDLEHIVQDALSNDGSGAVVRALAEEYGERQNLSVLLTEGKDSGQSDGLNRAIERASGEYIGWLNADEFYMPNAIESAMTAASQNPNADVIFGDCVFVDENAHYMRLLTGHRWSPFVLRHYGCYITSCATFVKRKALLGRPWDIRLRYAMDWDLWLDLASRGKFLYLPRPLGAFRVHGGQVTKMGRRGLAGEIGMRQTESSSELGEIRMKHGVRSSTAVRSVARLVHGGYKVMDLCYWREYHMATKYRTKDLRWWQNH